MFAEAFFSGDEWEIDQRNLIVCEDSKIGSGAFANVYKGRLRGPQRERLKGQGSAYESVTEWINVAVKISNDDFEDGKCAVWRLTSVTGLFSSADLNREIAFMKQLGSHAHVLCMLGCVSVGTDRSMLVTELCTNGDLLHWLREHSKCLSSVGLASIAVPLLYGFLVRRYFRSAPRDASST